MLITNITNSSNISYYVSSEIIASKLTFWYKFSLEFFLNIEYTINIQSLKIGIILTSQYASQDLCSILQHNICISLLTLQVYKSKT